MQAWSFLLISPLIAESLSLSSDPKSTMKGVTNIALSVDGFIAEKDGGVDWLNKQPMIEGEDFGFAEFLEGVDAILMGRNTFETVVQFGQEAWGYGEKPLYVLTRGDIGKVKTADWIPETVTIKSVASMEDFWGALEKEHPEYKAVYIDGGRTIQSFLKAGLMHRLNLTRIPTLLGEGIPLFYGTKVDLHHVSTKSYSNGFVTSTYDVKYDEK